jgi:predicted TIM-barrel fold metal-dependent hydrolase
MPYTHQVVILMHFGSCLEAVRFRMTNAMSPCSYISLPELNQSHMNTPIEGCFWMPSSTPNPEHPSGAMSIYKIRWVHSVDMPYTQQVVILMHFGSCIEAVRFRMTNAMSPCSYISLPELSLSHVYTYIEGYFWMPSSTPNP